jgi:hypothetical protein
MNRVNPTALSAILCNVALHWLRSGWVAKLSAGRHQRGSSRRRHRNVREQQLRAPNIIEPICSSNDLFVGEPDSGNRQCREAGQKGETREGRMMRSGSSPTTCTRSRPSRGSSECRDHR